MEMVINVNNSSCIRCGRCAKVCPALIFVQGVENGPIELHKRENCISCGHCVGACPSGAVEHSLFPIERIHKIDYTAMPTPDQVMLLCAARRSNRALLSRPVPDEVLAKIVEAADLAPTATNARGLGYVVVTDAQMLHAVSDFTISIFEGVLRKLTNPLLKPILRLLLPAMYRYVPQLKRMRGDFEAGCDPILRGATALVVIHADKANRFGVEDANLAYQNGSLMAEALGMSQIYMGFVLTAVRQDKKGQLEKMMGISGRNICAVMAVGVPQFRYPNYVEREASEVVKR